jgi:hypothetical protein
MKNYIAITILFLFNFLVNIAAANSQIIEIPKEQKIVDGIAMGIKPGDTLFIAAGNREELTLQNITGTAKKPVVVINRGGKVIINTKKDYGILFTNSIHFILTGIGSSDKYGFEIASTALHGLVVTEFSSFCEADHLEIHHVGFAAIVAKTDPNCTRKDLRFFIMQNLSFHDNLIHDTKAEGFYVGYSWHPARDYKCGEDSLLYSHQIHGVRIFNNNIHDSGQEGIQIGSGTSDIKIYSNNVYNYGITNELWQNHGVQIGQGTTGDFFNNKVSTGPAEAISLFGGGNNRVYDNVIINSGAAAIYQNDRGAIPGSNYQVMNNIIIDPKERGVTMVSNHTGTNKITGNIIVIKERKNAIVNEGSMKWDSSGNRVFSSIEEAGLDGGIIEKDTRKKITTEFPFTKDNTIKLVEVRAIINNKYLFSVAFRSPSVKLYSSAGVLLDAGFISQKGNEYVANLSSFPNGIYYVSVSSAGKPIELQRIILKKSK